MACPCSAARRNQRTASASTVSSIQPVGLLLIFESCNTTDEMFRNTRFINKLFGVAAREGAWSARPAALC